VGAKIKAALLTGALDPGELRESVQQLGDLIQQSIDSSRTLSVELSPPSLYKEGLASALRWLGRWMEEKHGLSVSVEAEAGADPETEAISTLLFQSVRELLLNVVKHAGVPRAAVAVKRLGRDRVRIVVRDEGAGFDPDRPSPGGSGPSGLGLFSIRERLDLIGGHLAVESSPGGGSRVTLDAPLRALQRQPS
jgi:signal transduction histidine kinase